jgi:hypothetical protein
MSRAWRLDLLGVDVGNRWIEVAQTWEAHADGRTYAFNDWHAVMAWLGAGRHHDVQRMLREWRDVAGDGNENTHWIRTIGLPLIEGFTAFREGDYALAIERLHATRHFACAFGGSNAQRDVIGWTLTEAALRGGQGAFARALVQERLSARPNSALNRGLLARATASPALQRRAA